MTSFSVTGIPRNNPNDPIIIILPGAGDVAFSHIAVQRLVSQFAQILLYDRAGIGCSETRVPPNQPKAATATTAAAELHALLQNAQIHPPYVLVGHSYGGIIAREYLHLYPDDIAGIVLSDSASDRQNEFFSVPDENINAVLGDLKWSAVTGLREEAVLTRDEWRTRAIQVVNSIPAANVEAGSFVEACRALRAKRQIESRALGTKPLSVIRCNSARDYERAYAKGVEAGNGTQDQQKRFRELLDRWDAIDALLMEEMCGLSANVHFVHLPDCGHQVHLIRPDVVADEIRWVLENPTKCSL